MNNWKWIVFNIGAGGYVPNFKGTRDQCEAFIRSQQRYTEVGWCLWMRPAADWE